MSISIALMEQAFAIFTLVFFTGILAFDSLYISPDPALAESQSSINPLYSILSLVQMGVYGTTILLLLLRWRSSVRTALQNKTIWLIIILTLSSFLWSDFFDGSLRKGINAFATSLFGFYLASRFSLREQIKLLMVSLGIVTLVSFLFSLAFPGAAIEAGANAGSWRGPLTQKNLLARVMLLSSFVFFFDMLKQPIKQRKIHYALISLSLLLVLLSNSKTALLILFILLMLTPLYLSLKLEGRILIPILISLILLVGSSTTILLSNWENITIALGRDPTLSGRTELWDAAFDMIAARPLLGYGFQSFWIDDGAATYIWKLVQYRPPHAHNGYINIALDLGLIGLFLFVLNLTITYSRSIRWAKLEGTIWGLFPLIYITFLIIYNQSENTIVEHNSIFWALFVSLSFVVSDKQQLKLIYTKD
jgi:O-antigen ligase